MADITPFIGTRYNSQLIGNLSKVVCPPYDAITPEHQKELYARHDQNMVRLELNTELREDDGFSNRYSRAANTLGTWRSDGILIEDDKPAFYLYEQEYKAGDGAPCKRRAVIARVKIEDLAPADMVKASRDLVGRNADRLHLLRATETNLSPVLGLYDDEAGDIQRLLDSRMTEKPWEEVVDDGGVIHRLWVVQKKDFMVKLVELMKARPLYLADGFHRMETALAYRSEMRQGPGKKDGKQPYDFIMACLTCAGQPGLQMTPVHRALTRNIMADVDLKDALEELAETFVVTKEKVDLTKPAEEAARMLDTLNALPDNKTTLAMVHASGAAFFLTVRDDVEMDDLLDDDRLPCAVKRLDVAVLHSYIINQVLVGNPEIELEEDECVYVEDSAKLLDLLRAKKAVLGFLLRPASHHSTLEILQKRFRLPQKTGCFFPRVITGLVLRNMGVEARLISRK